MGESYQPALATCRSRVLALWCLYFTETAWCSPSPAGMTRSQTMEQLSYRRRRTLGSCLVLGWCSRLPSRIVTSSYLSPLWSRLCSGSEAVACHRSSPVLARTCWLNPWDALWSIWTTFHRNTWGHKILGPSLFYFFVGRWKVSGRNRTWRAQKCERECYSPRGLVNEQFWVAYSCLPYTCSNFD